MRTWMLLVSPIPLVVATFVVGFAWSRTSYCQGPAADPIHAVVVDRTHILGLSGNEVDLVQFNAKEIRSVNVLQGVDQLACNDQGWILWRSVKGAWAKGCVQMKPVGRKFPDSRADLNPGSTTNRYKLKGASALVDWEPVKPPSDLAIESACISSDGQQVAWVVNTAQGMNDLILTAPDGSSATLLSTNDLVLLPSFSPTGDSIAFFRGPRNAPVLGGFTLALAIAQPSMKNGPAKPMWTIITIAPPARWTPFVTQKSVVPKWSPDGRLILFEARYGQQRIGYDYHTVRPDGANLLPAIEGTWSIDGKSILGFTRVGDVNTGCTFKLTRAEVSSTGVKLDVLDRSIAFFFPGAAWSPDGDYVAYGSIREGTSEVFLVILSVASGQERRIPEGGRPLFIRTVLPSFTIENESRDKLRVP